MATPENDPVLQLLLGQQQESQTGDPVLDILLSQQGPEEEEEKPGLGKRVAGTIERLGEMVDPAADPLRRAEIASELVAGAVRTLGGSAEALFEFPEEVARFTAEAISGEEVAETPLPPVLGGTLGPLGRKLGQAGDVVADWLSQSLEAPNAFTPQELEDINTAGMFMGYALPGVGTYKMAGLITGFGAGKGILAKDMLAGITFGLGFTEGDVEERVQAAAIEGAAAGVFSGVLAGVGYPLRAWRQGRATELARVNELREAITHQRDPDTGELRLVIRNKEAAAAINRILSEEDYISNSVAAQNLLARDADKRAFVEAVRDLAAGDGTHGILRGVRTETGFPQEPGGTIAALQEEFPNLKFQTVARGDGQFDLVFGPEGLDAQRMRQFKEQGFFEGQRLVKNGTEYQFISKAPQSADHIMVRRVGDDVVTPIKREGIVEKFSGTPPQERAPGDEALAEQFIDWFNARLDKLARSRQDMSADDLRAAVAEGRVQLDGSVPRDYRTPHGEAYYPGVGLMPDGQVPPTIQVRPQPGETVESYTARVQEVMLQQRQQAQAMGPVPGDGPIPQQAAALVEDILFVQYPDELARWDQIARQFLRDAGVEDDVLDAHTFGAYAANRWLRWAREQNPEDVELWRALNTELQIVLEDAAGSLERLGATQGFHVNRLPSGQVLARDMNTGLPLLYETEEAARAGFEAAVRDGRSFVGGMTPAPSGASTAATAGLDTPDLAPLIVPKGGTVAAQLEHDLRPPLLQNVRDWLLDIEGKTGLPVWSRWFEPLDQGQVRMHNRLVPFLKRIEQVWDGLEFDEMVEITHYWTRVEGQDLDNAAKRTIAKEMGLSARQLKAEREAREVFDEGFRIAVEELGLSPNRYIEDYFAHVLPFAEQNAGKVDLKKIFGSRNLTERDEAFFLHERTGELSRMERDPRLVMAKYFRNLMWEAEVAPVWRPLYKMVETDTQGVPKNALGLQSLDDETAESIRQAVGGEEGVDALRTVLESMLNATRGYPNQERRWLRHFMKRMFSRLNVTVPDEAFDAYANASLSMMYGATLGGRPRAVIRDFTANMFNGWTRFGGKHGGEALNHALTQQGYRQALDAGALRTEARGVPIGEQAFKTFMEEIPIEGEGVLGTPLAGALRFMLRRGHGGQKLSRKLLTGYTAMDDVNRSWVYHWQRLQAEDGLMRFDAGDLTQEELLNEVAPMYSRPILDRFIEIKNRLGNQKAASFLGRMASDETHFIYSTVAQPHYVQKPFGKAIGAFGNWPLWQKEMYIGRLRNATASQRAKFMYRTGAMMAALGLIAHETHTDLINWMAPTQWMTWAGGPALDIIEDFRTFVTGYPIDRATAARNLVGNAIQLQVPGYAVGRDITQALDMRDPGQAALVVALGRPERVPYSWVGANHFSSEGEQQLLANPSVATSRERFEALSGFVPPQAGGGTSASMTTLQANPFLEELARHFGQPPAPGGGAPPAP